MMREGLLDAVDKLHEVMYERIEKLHLKGEPYCRGVRVSKDETNDFFSV